MDWQKIEYFGVMFDGTNVLLLVLLGNSLSLAEKYPDNDYLKAQLTHHFTDEYFNTLYDKLHPHENISPLVDGLQEDSFLKENRRLLQSVQEEGQEVETDHEGNIFQDEKFDFENKGHQEVEFSPNEVTNASGKLTSSIPSAIENRENNSEQTLNGFDVKEESPFPSEDTSDENSSEKILHIAAGNYVPWSDVALRSLRQFPEPTISDDLAEFILEGDFSSPSNPLSSISTRQSQNRITAPWSHDRIITGDHQTLSFGRKRSGFVNDGDDASDGDSDDLKIERRSDDLFAQWQNFQPGNFDEGDEPRNSTAAPEPENVGNRGAPKWHYGSKIGESTSELPFHYNPTSNGQKITHGQNWGSLYGREQSARPRGYHKTFFGDHGFSAFAGKRSSSVAKHAMIEDLDDIQIERRLKTFANEQLTNFVDGDEPKNSTAPPEPDPNRDTGYLREFYDSQTEGRGFHSQSPFQYNSINKGRNPIYGYHWDPTSSYGQHRNKQNSEFDSKRKSQQ